jgi:hypothetical protein
MVVPVRVAWGDVIVAWKYETASTKKTVPEEEKPLFLYESRVPVTAMSEEIRAQKFSEVTEAVTLEVDPEGSGHCGAPIWQLRLNTIV